MKTAKLAKEKPNNPDFIKDLKVFVVKLKDRDWPKEQWEPGITSPISNCNW